MLAWTIVFLFFLGVFLVQRVYIWYRLSHVPGPPSAQFSKFWMLKHSFNGTLHMQTAEANFKYGPLVRIGPNQLVTNDVDLLRSMSSIKSSFRRSDWHDGLRFEADRDNVLSERDVEKHTTLRNKMAAGYSGREINGLEEAIESNIMKLRELLDSKYLSTASTYRPCDLALKLQYLTLDIIFDIAFCKSFGFLEADDDVYAYIKTTQETIPAMMVLGALPWLTKILHSRLFRGLMPSPNDAEGMGRIMRHARDIVRERIESKEQDRRDMLGSFFRHGLSPKEAESEGVVQILAGSDTTASALRTIMLFTTTNPPVLSRLIEELSSATISDPIKDAEARKLPYLQAVINESLRILPPINGLRLKLVPKGGVQVNNLFIPDGTTIGDSTFGVTLDPKLWGDDAKLFRPERWLEGTPEEIRRKEANMELLFGYGRWQCLGKSIARMELNKIIPELLRHYDFTIANPERPWKSFAAGIFITSDMWMRVTRREHEF